MLFDKQCCIVFCFFFRVLWAVSTDKLYAVLLNEGADFVVHQFNVRTGSQSGVWQNAAPWVHRSK